jgi:nucleotidyltransferase substrate binding protein (TIGR01987 family)
MEKLKFRYETIKKAEKTFQKALDDLHLAQKQSQPYGSISHEDIVQSMEDSLIQRFEYSIDLLWKYIKEYLEFVHKIVPEVRSPKTIIRESVKIGLLSETEGSNAIDMIESRNLTSHIYRKEIALMLVSKMPEFLELFKQIVDRLKP